MKGILWGWLLVLGAVFWASMLGLDYLYVPFITHNNTVPAAVVAAVPIEEVLEQSYLSKYAYQMLAASAIFGIAFYINRRYLNKKETKITNVKEQTVNEELKEEDTCTSVNQEEEEDGKNTLEVNNDDSSGDKEKNPQASNITPPSVDVRELQARLKEFEDNLAMLKQKGERLVTHTEMQKKRWEELNAGDQ